MSAGGAPDVTDGRDQATGMIAVGGSPARRNLPFVLATCGVPCLLLAAPTAPVFGDLPGRHVVAFACWLAVVAGGILLYLALAYRTIAFDPAAGTARLGHRTVPLASITRAKRHISVARTAVYRSYRFESTTGAWGRVLAEGRPLKGLDADGAARLRRFVEATGVPPDVDDELTPHQRFVADRASPFGASSPVGTRTILAELRGRRAPAPRRRQPDTARTPDDATGAAETAEAPRRGIGGPAEVRQDRGDAARDRRARANDDAAKVQRDRAHAARYRRARANDDAAALAFLPTQVLPGGTARRVCAWLTATVLTLGFVAVVVGAVAQQAAGGELDDGTNARIGGAVGTALVLGLGCYLGYCVATYRYRRAAQRASLAWLASRGDDQAARGLPPVLLVPFLGPPPAHALKSLAAYVAATFGMFLLIAGGVLLTPEVDLPPAAGVTTLGVGAAVAAGSVALFVSVARAQKRQGVLAMRLGGARLEAEMAELDDMDEMHDLEMDAMPPTNDETETTGAPGADGPPDPQRAPSW